MMAFADLLTVSLSSVTVLAHNMYLFWLWQKYHFLAWQALFVPSLPTMTRSTPSCKKWKKYLTSLQILFVLDTLKQKWMFSHILPLETWEEEENPKTNKTETTWPKQFLLWPQSPWFMTQKETSFMGAKKLADTCTWTPKYTQILVIRLKLKKIPPFQLNHNWNPKVLPLRSRSK